MGFGSEKGMLQTGADQQMLLAGGRHNKIAKSVAVKRHYRLSQAMLRQCRATFKSIFKSIRIARCTMAKIKGNVPSQA